MTRIPENSSVIVAGAGPSGLMMAAQLLRNGIQPVIIDSKTQIDKEPATVALLPGSLEIFRQLGLQEMLFSKGNVVSGIALHQENNEIVSLLYPEDTECCSFPFALTLEQSTLERILVDYLTANACPVYWNCELLDISQDDEGVDLIIQREDRKEHVRADWLVGADRPGSKVRQLLKIGFQEVKKQRNFCIAELNTPLKFGQDAVRFFYNSDGFAGVCPMTENRIAIISNLPSTLKGRRDLKFSDLKPYLLFVIGFPLDELECLRFSLHEWSAGIADRLEVQRCFLIGEALHNQSPILSQGINSGFQDAHNLAWKLAGLLKKEYAPRLLDTFSEERRDANRRLIADAEHFFTLLRPRKKFLSLLKEFLRVGSARLEEGKLVLPLLSQKRIDYRASALSVHLSGYERVRAGDRLPCITFYDEKQNQETDLHSWCNKPGFTLLVIGKLNSRDLFLLAKWITETYPVGLNLYYLPPSVRNKHLFDFFEISDLQKRVFIVRPDLYIGYLSDVVVIEMLESYLTGVVGWRK